MRATLIDEVPFVEVAFPEPGKQFGAYAIEHPVGQGGFGAVYRARDTRLDRIVALKVLLPSEVGDPQSVARFLREARLAASLEHPNVVRILEVGSIGDTPFIAMEWIDGTTLRHAKIARPTELLAIIAETLAFAHERGIVHRDLKPANIMIDRDGRPKLVDFGIAKRVAGPPATFATRDGVVLGTPDYMAPEQELTSAVDARADQWAWGAIAYELLTGDRPTRPALAHAALDERAGAVVLRALSMAPSERYASMRELLAAWRHAVVPVPNAAPPRRPSRVKLFAATTATVVAIGCLALAIASSARRPEPAIIDAAVDSVIDAAVDAAGDAPSVETPVSHEAESTAVDAATHGASVERRANAKPEAGPGVLVVRALSVFYIDGSAYVDRDALTARMRALRPAFERCVVGVPLTVSIARDKIVARVRVEEATGETYVDFLESNRSGSHHGAVAVWPPPAVRTCMAAVIRQLNARSTIAGHDAFYNLTFELAR